MLGESDERPPKPAKPKDLETPGLVYRERKDGRILLWSPRSDLVARGLYPKTTRRLWPPSGANPTPPEPTREEWEEISARCERHQVEMLRSTRIPIERTDPKFIFDGTIKSLSRLYQTHDKSKFKKLRYQVQVDYARRLRVIEETIGEVRVPLITFLDLMRWYEEFAAPHDGGRPKKATARLMLKILKQIFLFGTLALPETSGCAKVVEIMRNLAEQRTFASGRRQRKEYVTYPQAVQHCEASHREGFDSIALAQAFMFECGMRPKDVIGEWVPTSEPGVTDVFNGQSKWLMGARWEEVDENFVWKHRLSKSVPREGIMDPETGKTELFDLREFQLVRSELERIAPLHRSNFPGKGPIIVSESTGLPWSASRFRDRWREIARKADIPDNVQNRDSRAGAATEADPLVRRDKVQRMLGHSREETTAGYQRESMEIRTEIARARKAHRERVANGIANDSERRSKKSIG
jgi:hypothetical protein